MEMFEFCLEIIRRESIRFNINLENSIAKDITAAVLNDINFDIVSNRCAYMYRCGAINLTFSSECFHAFVMQYSNVESLFNKWSTSSDLTFCSFTTGPALDYISFLMSFNQYRPNSFRLFKNMHLITKHGAWRNSVVIMEQMIKEGWFRPLRGVALGDLKVIQGDQLVNFNDKAKNAVCNSDVIMMMKSIKFKGDDTFKEAMNLMNFLESMKPEAILFFIDIKPVTDVFLEILSKFPGSFLVKPDSLMTRMDFDCPDIYRSIFKCPPTISARGVFFVWQKGKESGKLNILNKFIASEKKETASSSVSLNKKDSDNMTSKANDSLHPESISEITNMIQSFTLNKESKYSNDICKHSQTISDNASNFCNESGNKKINSSLNTHLMSTPIENDFKVNVANQSLITSSEIKKEINIPTHDTIEFEKGFTKLQSSTPLKDDNSVFENNNEQEINCDFIVFPKPNGGKQHLTETMANTYADKFAQSITPIKNKGQVESGKFKDGNSFLQTIARLEDTQFNNGAIAKDGINDSFTNPQSILQASISNTLVSSQVNALNTANDVDINFSSQFRDKLISLNKNYFSDGASNYQQKFSIATPSDGKNFPFTSILDKTNSNSVPATPTKSTKEKKVPNMNVAQKISSLTQQVQDLTQTIHKLVQIDSHEQMHKTPEQCNNPSTNVCSSNNNARFSCIHKCCHSIKPLYSSACCKNICVTHCCQKHMCQSQINSCFSQSNCCHDNKIKSNQNNLIEGPNLVIPLNSLSSELVQQIISSLSQR